MCIMFISVCLPFLFSFTNLKIWFENVGTELKPKSHLRGQNWALSMWQILKQQQILVKNK